MTAFLTALLGAARPFVMEIKRRDPHGRDLLGPRTVAEVVDRYERAGAPCLSVVTGRWFGGDTELLREVTARTDRPVLQKDFITRRDQLDRARDLGASAVLLTAGLLPAAALGGLVDGALSRGLTPLVEVTSAEEIAVVPRPADCVVAVNNKDIRHRERGSADLDRSRRLLPALRGAGVGCPVSASGIAHAADAADLLSAGYSGLLVGTGLLRVADMEGWLDDVDRLRGRDDCV